MSEAAIFRILHPVVLCGMLATITPNQGAYCDARVDPQLPEQMISPSRYDISVDQPAYIGLPVWLNVHVRNERLGFGYPYSGEPGDIGPNRVEMMRDGTVLPRRACSSPPGKIGIAGDTSFKWDNQLDDRLPLNLLFDLDTPGTYSVRWSEVGSEVAAEFRRGALIAQSDWKTFDVRASTEAQREAWFKALLSNKPVTPERLISEFLPSLLSAPPNSRVAQAVVDLLYQADDRVALAVRSAIFCLHAPDLPARLVDAIEQHGLTEIVVQLLEGFWPGLTDEQKRRVEDLLVAKLLPVDIEQTSDALEGLSSLAHPLGYEPDAAETERIDRIIIGAAPAIIRENDRVTRPYQLTTKRPPADALALYLWRMKSDRETVRALLMKITTLAPPTDEQARIVLSSLQ